MVPKGGQRGLRKLAGPQREGDTLDDGYRVDAIAPKAVTLVYLPLNVPQEHVEAGEPILETCLQLRGGPRAGEHGRRSCGKKCVW